MQDLYCEKVKFLEKMGIKDAKLDKIPADASFRYYERLKPENLQKILMVAPPDKEDITPFIKIAEILRENGLNPPEIYGFDEKEGLMLLRDFGNNLFSEILRQKPHLERELYLAAIDVLLNLEKVPDSGQVELYTPEKLLSEAELLTQWAYNDLGSEANEEYRHIWQRLIEQISTNKVLVLRDFHADNLMWLPEGKNSYEKVGLLDFQDAVMGSPAYDLLSLLEDARRDVSDNVSQECFDYFLTNTGFDKATVIKDYNILAAQRNCKIVGIFHRLKKRDGKDNYLKFIPRVVAHLKNDLQREGLGELKQWFDNYVSKL